MGTGTGTDAGVVVGVDDTHPAFDAVRWAAGEARLRATALQIVHAAAHPAGGDGPEELDVRGVLGAAFTVARRVAPGLAVSTRPTVPGPVDGTVQLLVMGVPDQGAYELLPASIALDGMGRARCPVAVVRGRTGAGDEPVVVGVDDPGTDAAALGAAFVEADLRGSALIVLHADSRPGAPTDDVAARLTAAVAGLAGRYPRVRARIRTVRDTPADALLAAATAARLVVVGGARGRGPAVRALFGSHSRLLLRHSPVPVLVVAPSGLHPLPGAAGIAHDGARGVAHGIRTR